MKFSLANYKLLRKLAGGVWYLVRTKNEVELRWTRTPTNQDETIRAETYGFRPW